MASKSAGTNTLPAMVMSPFFNSTACIEVRPAADAGRSRGLNGAPLASLDRAAAVGSGVPDEHATSVMAELDLVGPR